MSDVTVKPAVSEQLGKIALIGGGKMGEAIVAGLVHGAFFDPSSIEIAEPNEARRAYLSEAYGVDCVKDGTELVGVTTVLMAVKPQVFKQVAESLMQAEHFKPERVISIAAGVTTKTISELFGAVPVIRVMPNAPLLASSGMSVVAVAEDTPNYEGELVVELFSLMGDALLIDEDKINAATAISGSGPAYFALLTEELARAGKAIGLTEEQAEHLSLQTFVGTARQLQLTEESPAELRQAVTSPGGTTQAALESFTAQNFGGIVQEAVEAALKRAEELG